MQELLPQMITLAEAYIQVLCIAVHSGISDLHSCMYIADLGIENVMIEL